MSDTKKQLFGQTVYCPKCKKQVDYTIGDGLAECETPIGVVQTVIDKIFCKECTQEIMTRALRDYNYLSMVKSTMGFWRKQNPEGTKKQCRRALGIPNRQTVDTFWDICMDDVPVEQALAPAEQPTETPVNTPVEPSAEESANV